MKNNQNWIKDVKFKEVDITRDQANLIMKGNDNTRSFWSGYRGVVYDLAKNPTVYGHYYNCATYAVQFWNRYSPNNKDLNLKTGSVPRVTPYDLRNNQGL